MTISRTLGLSIGSTLGISSTPEVSVIKIAEDMTFLVLATDGLWEVMSNTEVIDFLTPYYHKRVLSVGIKFLISEAVLKWEQRQRCRDDITILIIEI